MLTKKGGLQNRGDMVNNITILQDGLTKGDLKMSNENMVSLVDRTSNGLRNALFDELDSIRAGNSDPKRANAVARISSEIVRTVDMELRVAQHMKTMTPATEEVEARLPEAIKLGTTPGKRVK